MTVQAIEVPSLTLLSFAASSGVGLYESSAGLRRLDIVTGEDEFQGPGGHSQGTADFDVIPVRVTFDSRDELVSYLRTEYLRDKKNIYYTILFTNRNLGEADRLAITKFLDEPSLKQVTISSALVPTLKEITDPSLAHGVKELAKRSDFRNVTECLSTELQEVFRTSAKSKAIGSPDVVGYYVKFVEAVKHRMTGEVPGKQVASERPPITEQQIIGRSLIVKGELSGSESLYIDGRVEGAINLSGRVTIGRHGVVAANITASNIEISGKVRGNLIASDRVDIRSDGSLTGDVVAARISIEDGAFFKGGIDIRKAGHVHSDGLEGLPVSVVPQVEATARR